MSTCFRTQMKQKNEHLSPPAVVNPVPVPESPHAFRHRCFTPTHPTPGRTALAAEMRTSLVLCAKSARSGILVNAGSGRFRGGGWRVTGCRVTEDLELVQHAVVGGLEVSLASEVRMEAQEHWVLHG